MPNVDFEMTYPCYFLHNAAGNPEVVQVDGNTCLCLFTDQDFGRAILQAPIQNEPRHADDRSEPRRHPA